MIDADAFKESLIHCDGLGRRGLEAVLKTLKEQPTAYDVDKVVAELEEERMRYFLTIANTGDASLDIAYKEVSGAIEKTIDIVKRGGVEC